MAYIYNIPGANDLPSVSQGQILNNFGLLGSIAGNTQAASASINATSGFNWIYLPPQGQKPPAAASFPAGNVGLYSFLDPVTNINELYVNKSVQIGAAQIAMTSSVLSTTYPSTVLSAGWTRLPSGILLKWAGNVAANGNTLITFPVAANIPVFSVCLSITVSPYDTSGADANTAVSVGTITPTTFNVFGSTRAAAGATAMTFNYLAIGY